MKNEALIIRELGAQINAWRLLGVIDTVLPAVMDRHLANFSEIIGGCERIDNTPVPFLMMFCCAGPFLFIAIWLLSVLPTPWVGSLRLSSRT